MAMAISTERPATPSSSARLCPRSSTSLVEPLCIERSASPTSTDTAASRLRWIAAFSLMVASAASLRLEFRTAQREHAVLALAEREQLIDAASSRPRR